MFQGAKVLNFRGKNIRGATKFQRLKSERTYILRAYVGEIKVLCQQNFKQAKILPV